MKKQKQIYIGTSGWHYPHWYKEFYPEDVKAKDLLAYFATYFDTVEINNTFYRLPNEKTVKTWYELVPKNFIFSVKGSRYITHVKKLKDPEEGLKRFFSVIEVLDDKLGPILFQLPARFKPNLERFSEFLGYLSKSFKYVFEFRNPAWLIPEVLKLLKAHKIGLCLYDFSGYKSSFGATSDLVYMRLHGPRKAYQDSYSEQDLTLLAQQMKNLAPKHQIYCYFDNDERAYAVHNALMLKSLIK